MARKNSVQTKPSKKVYFNFDQQIEKLKSDGLIIADEKRAKTRLKWEGYYNFAVGYNRLFKDEKKRYVKGTTFEHIEALFDFDKHLRGLVYEYAQGVECNLKALISDVFSRNYGVDERLYLREENFTDAPADKQYVRWIIGTCRATLESACKLGAGCYRDYIAYYRKTYGHVPFWALIRALTFGNTSKFLYVMKKEDGREIARAYGLDFDRLRNMAEVAVCFRNIAAHGERVYNAKLPSASLDGGLAVFPKVGFKKNADGSYRHGRRDFAAFLVVCKYLLPQREFADCMERVRKEVEKLESALLPSSFEKVMDFAGLSGDWKRLDELG